MMIVIGSLGLICIVAAWIPQTIVTVKQGRSDMHIGFLVMTAIGNFSLTIYSFFISDPIYMSLNGLALSQGLINLYYKIYPTVQV